MDIYVVEANAGSYSNEDVDSWIVCAYADAELAKQHAAKAQLYWRRLDKLSDKWRELRMHNWPPKATTWLSEFGDPRVGSNPYDPDMRWNSDIRYNVVCTPLREFVGRLR